jgi:thioester reductase-like protein
MKIFITGATGFLGKNYLKALLKNTEHEFYLLIRSEESKKLIQTSFKWADPDRIHYIKGDITEKDFGISSEDLKTLKKIDNIYHFAASTSFDDRQKKDIIKTNIEGTKNIVGLSKKIKDLKNLYFVSTAYIAGLNKGPIYEDEMPPIVDFRNSYEESKYDAELIIRKNKELPWSIFRPSIIVGDSKNYDSQGETRMVYGYILGIYYSLLKEFSKEEIADNWINRKNRDVNPSF